MTGLPPAQGNHAALAGWMIPSNCSCCTPQQPRQRNRYPERDRIRKLGEPSKPHPADLIRPRGCQTSRHFRQSRSSTNDEGMAPPIQIPFPSSPHCRRLHRWAQHGSRRTAPWFSPVNAIAAVPKNWTAKHPGKKTAERVRACRAG